MFCAKTRSAQKPSSAQHPFHFVSYHRDVISDVWCVSVGDWPHATYTTNVCEERQIIYIYIRKNNTPLLPGSTYSFWVCIPRRWGTTVTVSKHEFDPLQHISLFRSRTDDVCSPCIQSVLRWKTERWETHKLNKTQIINCIENGGQYLNRTPERNPFLILHLDRVDVGASVSGLGVWVLLPMRGKFKVK